MQFIMVNITTPIDVQWQLTITRFQEWTRNDVFRFKWWALLLLFILCAYIWCIAYLEHIANPSLLQILCDKLSKLDYDGFIGIGYLEQIIADHPNSIFPQYLATERPDKSIAALLEGRFLIMLQETSFVLIVPVTIDAFVQAPDDYTVQWIGGSYLFLLRKVAIFVTLFLPGIYINT